MTDVPPGDETWTVGEAAKFLGFGISPRIVARWIDTGQVVGVQSRGGSWRRVLASSVRVKRAELEAQVSAGGPQASDTTRARVAGISPVAAARLLRTSPDRIRVLVDNYIRWCECLGVDPAGPSAPPVPSDDAFLKGWRVPRNGSTKVERRVDRVDVERRVRPAVPVWPGGVSPGAVAAE